MSHMKIYQEIVAKKDSNVGSSAKQDNLNHSATQLPHQTNITNKQGKCQENPFEIR